jgi:hypothetical protein
MNPILEAFLIATTCGVVVFSAGALIGIVWFAMERDHEADAPSGGELDIPADREFIDGGFVPASIPPIECAPFTRFDANGRYQP